MNERERVAPGIYAVVMTMLLLVCLVGAFVLPPSWVNGQWLASLLRRPWIGIPFYLCILFGVLYLLRLAHRGRIYGAVRELGGTVVRIRKLPFWRQRWGKYRFFEGTQFEVEYVDLLGLAHRRLCNSGFFQGVEWLSDEALD